MKKINIYHTCTLPDGYTDFMWGWAEQLFDPTHNNETIQKVVFPRELYDYLYYFFQDVYDKERSFYAKDPYPPYKTPLSIQTPFGEIVAEYNSRLYLTNKEEL